MEASKKLAKVDKFEMIKADLGEDSPAKKGKKSKGKAKSKAKAKT